MAAGVRFDDRIATVLAMPADRPDRRAAQWRQLVDLLAQPRAGASALAREAFHRLRELAPEVPIAERRAVAASLAGLPIAPGLVGLFADDHPSVAAPLIAGARLEEEEWLALLPRLGPTARALLRHRRDLPEAVARALAGFGASDLVLGGAPEEALAQAPAAAPAPSPAQASPPAPESQIRELVERIESYRRQRGDAGAAAVRTPAEASADFFRWETEADGVIFWVDGAPRTPIIGHSVAAVTDQGLFGVDGQATGAFEKRAAFRDARFHVAGSGPAAGDWRISGVPFFDPQRGSFLGYRGTARRPRLDEVARPAQTPGVFGTDLPPDSLRQLIHELRTPLNAVIGFAEMIEGQYLGTADSADRARAAEIMTQAGRLLAAVDDLDTAARLETHRWQPEEGAVDAATLLVRLHESYDRAAQQRGARIRLFVRGRVPPARVEPGAAERMVARLLSASVGLAQAGEVIGGQIGPEVLEGKPMICLRLDRPAAVAGRSEAELLDPGYSPDGDWPDAPALGLGFALRLVRNMADAVGGALLIAEDSFALFFPAVERAGLGTSRDHGAA